ncbi:MAG: hypothetical protein JXA18_13960 [Chitinispirillaceae bacterium]|nr:hypothetical protein [Chitinispirillaceae bacterium]
MIPAICRSIPALLCVVGSWRFGAAGEPSTVIDSFQNRLSRIGTFTVSVERLQTYRGVRRTGGGSVVFDRHIGCLYAYQTPGTYLFFSGDSAIWGVDLEKRTGWREKASPPGADLRRRIDPLLRLFGLLAIDKKNFTYRGNSGDLLLFSLPADGAAECCAGFDAATFQCRIIETFDATGALLDKTAFAYRRQGDNAIFPAKITITERIGTEVSVDSILLKKPRINGKLPAGAFDVPDGISWRTWQSDSLLKEQFDPVPGR